MTCFSRKPGSNDFIVHSSTILTLPGSLPLVSPSRYSSNRFRIPPVAESRRQAEHAQVRS